MTEITSKVEERTPYVIVAFQECQRMNYLTNEIKRSLKELDLGLKVGTHTISQCFLPTIQYNRSSIRLPG